MQRSPSHSSPSRNERKTIAFLTLFFVLVSTLFHFLIGDLGTRGFRTFTVAAQPTPRIDGFYKLIPPSPTPRPTPVPSPSPRPPKASASVRPANAKHAPRILVTPPRRHDNEAGGEAPSPYTTAQPGPAISSLPTVPVIEPSPPPVSPAPADHRDMIVAAEFEHRVIPSYPAIAVSAGWEGTVIVLVTIGPDGIIEAHVGTSSGYAPLDRAAVEAAKESTYRPPEVNGQPAIETYRVIYTFSL